MLFAIVTSLLGSFQGWSGLEPQDAAAVFKLAQPSIVTVVAQRDQSTSTGAGFLVYDGQTVATALHVLRDAERVQVTFHDGTKVDVEGLVSFDNQRDLALVRIRPTQRKALKLCLDDPQIGERIFAIGAPKGLEFSISEGIIGQIRTLDGFKQYQFTAPISPGNSGGPLLNQLGEVVGVVCWTVADGRELNFATPTVNIQAMERSARLTAFPLVALSGARLPFSASSSWPAPRTGEVSVYRSKLIINMDGTKAETEFVSTSTVLRVEQNGVYVVREKHGASRLIMGGQDLGEQPAGTRITTYAPNGQIIALEGPVSEEDWRIGCLSVVVWPAARVSVGSSWSVTTKGDPEIGAPGCEYSFMAAGQETVLGIDCLHVSGTAKLIGISGASALDAWVSTKDGSPVRTRGKLTGLIMSGTKVSAEFSQELEPQHWWYLR